VFSKLDALTRFLTPFLPAPRFAGANATVPMLAEPTSAQREAFDLIDVPIPPILK
jgi:hypothetical protein